MKIFYKINFLSCILLTTILPARHIPELYQTLKGVDQKTADSYFHNLPCSLHNKFIKEIAKRKNDSDDIITTWNTAYHTIIQESTLETEEAQSERQNAYHEAGHALFTILMCPFLKLAHVQIPPTRQRPYTAAYCRVIPARYHTWSELCTFLPENNNLKNLDPIKSQLCMLFAGGCAEQVYQLPTPVKINNATIGLDDFSSRLGTQGDLQKINYLTQWKSFSERVVATSIFCLTAQINPIIGIPFIIYVGLTNNPEKEEQIMQEAYEETIDMIKKNGDKIEHIARLLEEKKSLEEKDINDLYRLYGKIKPVKT